jgi:two-component system CheB/CheR fusion protein
VNDEDEAVAEAVTGSPDVEFERLLEFIKTERGFDFTGYKRPTLIRRVQKRMQAVGIDGYSDYREHLDEHDAEFVELFDTILINVTGFFRDPPAWAFLAEEIVPALLARKAPDEAVRVWSAGCATGEEAYSLAILFAEALGEEAFRNRTKIYATDVDDAALTDARHGRYPAASVEDVPDALRDKYFEPLNGRFAFRAELRRSVIFGRNDILQDPPISRIDLIAARNTLMYFRPEAQRRILSSFHFALNPEGYLFLGKSEVLLTRSNLFEPVDLKRRIFSKVPRSDLRDGLRELVRSSDGGAPARVADHRVSQAGFESAPVAQVVVDRAGFLAAANMQARTLFSLSPKDLGRPLQDLELSYRPIELRSRIDDVYSQHHAVNVRDVEWSIGGDSRWFEVSISPLHGADGTTLGTAITFADTSRFRRLQDTLEHSKERLETAFEELQSTNEELETTNEELQSTNEELETMNEELQSTNEELETMNDELRTRTDELNQVNAFLESILGSLQAGVVVTDRELRVQAWNDEATELWGLRSDEVHGQHLMNLDIGLQVESMMPLLRGVLSDSSEQREIVLEARNRRGRDILCRVTASPLLASTGEVRGAIIVMEEQEPAKPE